jgi:protein-disulfide isomerase
MTFKTGLVIAAVAAIVSIGILGIAGLYFVNNPEMLVRIGTKLERRQLEVQRQKAIADHADALFRSDKAPFVGNPNGDVTVVEFSDYNCGYCRRAVQHVAKLVENDGKVKVVFKHLPVFGEDSVNAARGALAAAKQDKYFVMHQRLLDDPGRANKSKVLSIANAIGLDVHRLEKDMESEDVRAALAEARELSEKLELTGTPYYLIGDQIIGGAPPNLYEQLVQEVAEVREQG